MSSSIAAVEDLLRPIHTALEKVGITPDYLAQKLEKELNAEEVKVFNDKEDGIVYSAPLIAWDVRQKARMDAHKLLGHYSPQEIKMQVSIEEFLSVLPEPIKALVMAGLKQAMEANPQE
jgi:hypothetical protein